MNRVNKYRVLCYNELSCSFCYFLNCTTLFLLYSICHVEIKIYSYSRCALNIIEIAMKYRRDGVVVRASASQLVDLGFNPLVDSYQKTYQTKTIVFQLLCLAFRVSCGEQAGKFACFVLGQDT